MAKQYTRYFQPLKDKVTKQNARSIESLDHAVQFSHYENTPIQIYIYREKSSPQITENVSDKKLILFSYFC